METNQEVFAGFTSTAGPEGGGTAFTINSDGTGFTLVHTFRKLGFTPTGNLIQARDGLLYGMTSLGGAQKAGTVFKMTLEGATTILYDFDTFGANSPFGSLVEGPDGNFYGLSASGGLEDYGAVVGTVFRVTPQGEFTKIKNLSKAEGYRPYGDLVLGPQGLFYGLAHYGGAYDAGTAFSITLEGSMTVLHSFNGADDGGWPRGSLALGHDGNLYGMTSADKFGRHNGTIFRISPAGEFTVLKSLQQPDGAFPFGSLVQHPDGYLYGMTSRGGDLYSGTIFRISLEGDFRVLRHLDAVTDGGTPLGKLTVGADGYLYGTSPSGGNYTGTLFRMSPEGELTVLHHMLAESDGCVTNSLLLASDGNFYGMASEAGIQSGGTIFRLSPQGEFRVLESLPGSYQGSTPVSSLTPGPDGSLYGMTRDGGDYGTGTIFRLERQGTFTVLRSLENSYFKEKYDGFRPLGSLTLARDGNFYGLMPEGGFYNCGTIFRFSPAGEYTVLYAFEGGEYGSSPWGSLTEGPDGALYGMTQTGGFHGSGVVFRASLEGNLSVLHPFNYSPDGAAPRGSLLLGLDGNFYGLTALGGEFNRGTIFRVSPAGDFATLFSFTLHEHGGTPFGDLIQDPEGHLYGLANSGGRLDGGTIFRCTLAGEVTVLQHLSKYDSSGYAPTGSLLRTANGSLYGLVSNGGLHHKGAIFQLSPEGVYSLIHSFHGPGEGREPLGSLVLVQQVAEEEGMGQERQIKITTGIQAR
ncbi:MAG: choice-of-anchor tandem repeat GloVer-containing protein [Adhaeribacter sp.]